MAKPRTSIKLQFDKIMDSMKEEKEKNTYKIIIKSNKNKIEIKID